MWTCDQFRAFLSGQGQAAQWGVSGGPGDEEGCGLQTAQDLVESSRGSFELYGANFMLGVNYVTIELRVRIVEWT